MLTFFKEKFFQLKIVLPPFTGFQFFLVRLIHLYLYRNFQTCVAVYGQSDVTLKLARYTRSQLVAFEIQILSDKSVAFGTAFLPHRESSGSFNEKIMHKTRNVTCLADLFFFFVCVCVYECVCKLET